MNSEMLIELETFFMALADKTRLRLLNLMRDGEICVCFFTEVLEESQPKISRHLAYLRNAGLVEARRDGKWMHYKIIEPTNQIAANILRETLASLQTQADLQQDYARLEAACCKISAPIMIEKVQKLNIFAETHIYQPKQELETFLL
jgi:ArsR family transcriptional regulator, arsenate/arsenite/antimonite-responsive transcriptional repressor